MRVVSYFSEKPDNSKVVYQGKRATVFIREDIQEHIVTEQDGTERTEWSATEYTATVNANSAKVTKELKQQIIEKNKKDAAKEVREKRDALLKQSDIEMMNDRLEKMTDESAQEWKDYRQALRDITEQEGFPFEVVFPEMPVTEYAEYFTPINARVSDLEDAVVELAEIITEV